MMIVGGITLAHRFSNLNPSHKPHGAAAIARWGIIDRVLGRRRTRPPGPPAPSTAPDLELIHGDSPDSWLTWLGHASFLGSMAGRRFLIDPVFSTHAGWLYRRHLPPPLTTDELPRIDAILVTHNHYDHLDALALRKLPPDVLTIVPKGLGPWCRRRGRRNVHELDWWNTVQLDGLGATLVPSCHWSRRGIFDTNRALWGGFVIEGGGSSIYHSGDTAWFDGFSEIGARFPDLDAALLPIGGYEPGWFMEHYHLNPEQAGLAFRATGARRMIPMHWGTFQLTDESLCAPVERIREWWRSGATSPDHQLKLLAVGESVTVGGTDG
jgi:L-ascorbate metabolism protein UlaG (beta-lactamase superfamily)